MDDTVLRDKDYCLLWGDVSLDDAKINDIKKEMQETINRLDDMKGKLKELSEDMNAGFSVINKRLDNITNRLESVNRYIQ